MTEAVIDHDAQFAKMANELADLYSKNELLTESMADMVLAYDSIGWVPLGGDYQNGRGVPLFSLKRWTHTNEQLLAINPLIKRGSNIRVSYIFGEEIEWQKDKPAAKKIRDANQDLIFSQQGLTELEKNFMASGNNFLLLDRFTQKITRVPLHEITNVAVVPGSHEEVLYWQRTWTESVTTNSTSANNDTTTRIVVAWYPVPDLDTRQWKDTSINGEPVIRDKALLHMAVNRQVGWLYGVPDIQPAVFWAKAYKEFLESNYTLVKALAKFTWKVTASTPAGVRRAASKMAAAIPYDPLTFQRGGSGGSAVLGAGEDLQAVNKAGANVNFDAGKPLAAMVASALEVNVVHLLSDPSIGSTGSADTLDTPQLKAMQARQLVFKRGFEKIFTFFGLPNVRPKFPPIQWEPVHRMMQGITTAASTNALHPEETRQLIINVMRQYGIDPLGVLPPDGRNAQFVSGISAQDKLNAATAAAQANNGGGAPGSDNQSTATQAKTAKPNTNPGTSPQKTPKGSSGAKGRGPAGAIGQGDHSQRASQ